jgi:hypothetical protein
VAGMVHADDPLTPGHVFDRITRMRPLPIHHGSHLLSRSVKKDVLRPVIAVHQHGPLLVIPGVRLLEVDRVDPP